ncbi:unnamed protein product [Pleuronectes platessa]|uniref:Uncharacterized protein n=1 Tax=Pleuronectes platessa TaxID=8262 RepID=A0A9N7TVR2_PLEPL|nr:unnamed protein product [Pleuronectes platessa]
MADKRVCQPHAAPRGLCGTLGPPWTTLPPPLCAPGFGSCPAEGSLFKPVTAAKEARLEPSCPSGSDGTARGCQWSTAADDVLQRSGEIGSLQRFDNRPCVVLDNRSAPGSPVTRRTTENDTTGLSPSTPACWNDVRPVLLISSGETLNEPPRLDTDSGLRRVGSRRDMGERAEQMQWVSARHRQNTGERQRPAEI